MTPVSARSHAAAGPRTVRASRSSSSASCRLPASCSSDARPRNASTTPVRFSSPARPAAIAARTLSTVCAGATETRAKQERRGERESAQWEA